MPILLPALLRAVRRVHACSFSRRGAPAVVSDSLIGRSASGCDLLEAVLHGVHSFSVQ